MAMKFSRLGRCFDKSIILVHDFIIVQSAYLSTITVCRNYNFEVNEDPGNIFNFDFKFRGRDKPAWFKAGEFLNFQIFSNFG